SARARILGTILAVALVGFLIVGSVTFLVQRERTLREVDNRLSTQVATLDAMASPTTDGPHDAALPGMTMEDLAGGEFASVEEYLRDAVRRLVPGRNEASVGVIDTAPRLVPQTLSGFDISQNHELIA